MDLRKILRIISLPVFLLLSLSVFAQNRVTGRITDAGGVGIPGVSVTVKGSTTGTTTDASGSYSLSVPQGATLVVSSIGYETREVAVTGNSMSVSLQTVTSNLNEVVVIGYGATRKRDITGSVSNVTSKDFQKGVITTPEQLIAGKVAGVAVTSNGGAPGSGSTIRIRGGASLRASNDPLIVIDGVPLDYAGISGAANPLSLVNPNDIESFSILKDASAAAIYGSRASNGVILITTKKGRTGKPTVNFSTQFSVSKIMKEVDVMSPEQFRAYVTQYGTAAQAKMLGSENHNWQDLIYQTAFGTDNNISVSGGVKSLPYRLSYGYLNQEGILQTDKLQRHSLSLNLSPSLLADHLKINLNVKGSMSKTRFANQGAIGAAVNFDPTQPINSGNNNYGGYFEYLDPNNSITGLKALAPLNPLGILLQRDDRSDVRRAISNAQIDYKLHFFPDLHANVNVGYDVSEGKGTVYIPDYAASSYKRFQSPSGSNTYYSGQNTQYRQKNQNKLLETFLSYAKDIKSIHSHVDAVAGYSYQDFKTTNYNFADYSANGTLNPGTQPQFAFNAPQHTLISYYGRVNYNYEGRYFITGTIRRDGSSRFAPSNRWGTFPSGAIAWKIKDESFLKNVQALNDLKLRIGYGITGQQEGIGLYDYISYYNLSDSAAMYQLGNTFYKMYRPGGYYSNRKWEQTATFNIALDFAFANNRINGTIEYYKKKTKDMLNDIVQPAGVNFTNKITANIGTMENEGVEFTINTQPIKSSDLNWDLNFNVTYNSNVITNLTPLGGLASPGLNQVNPISGGVGSFIGLNQVGNPLNAFYVYQQVYDQSGKPIEGLYVDRNRDGVIDQNDLYLYHSPNPSVYFGVSTGITYKKWSAGVVLRGSFDNYVYNNTWSSLATQRNVFNPLGWLNNAPTNLMETNFTGNGDKYLLSDYYVQNASFLKMDNANLAYDFGRVWNSRANLRVSFNVQNVFTITKYKGLDPEIGRGVDMNFYPRPRTFILGANLTF